MSTVLANTITAVSGGGSTVKVANDATFISDGGAITNSNLVQGICKGWALTDFAAAQNDDSFNVSTYTDYSAGYGQLTWNNDFSNANYAVAQACSGSDTNPNCVPGSNGNSSKAAGTIRINTMDTSNATPSGDMIDYAEFGTIAMGDLA